jgi:4-amino-4-deoxy-L-arabinose transferase-like glycosyltransferase
MPFAALCALALALLHGRRGGMWRVAAAGLVAGCAFLVRHPGLALLPAGWLVLAWLGWGGRPLVPRAYLAGLARPLGAYTIAFLLAIAPQVAVNLRDTGQPLYSQQAKNIWLAVFGDGDWGRWGEASNDVSAADVLLQDPGRFAANLSGNLRAFAGSGAEDQSEFGRAIQLRLLGFPANWLAVAGLLGWLWALARRRPEPAAPAGLLGWVALYTLTVAVGFALQRFFLPLAAVYAIAAGWALARIRARYGARASLALGLALAALLWGGFAAGASAVLRPAEVGDAAPGQPADALGAARLALAALRPGERLAVRVPADDDAGLALAKYSAVAHLVAPGAGTTASDVRGSGAAYLLWSERLGEPPPVGPEVGRSGQYALYRVQQ